jgi:hypothetical protein
LQLLLYIIGNFRDKSSISLYKKGLGKKLGDSNFESTEGCYQHLVKCIHQAAKEALVEKMLGSNTEPFYYRNEEIRKLLRKKKENILNGLIQKTHKIG